MSLWFILAIISIIIDTSLIIYWFTKIIYFFHKYNRCYSCKKCQLCREEFINARKKFKIKKSLCINCININNDKLCNECNLCLNCCINKKNHSIKNFKGL